MYGENVGGGAGEVLFRYVRQRLRGYGSLRVDEPWLTPWHFFILSS